MIQASRRTIGQQCLDQLLWGRAKGGDSDLRALVLAPELSLSEMERLPRVNDRLLNRLAVDVRAIRGS